MHDTSPSSWEQSPQAVPFFETILRQALPPEPVQEGPRGRGRPQTLSWPHLWFRLILGILQGMASYQDLWRRLQSEPLGPYPPLQISDDAVVKRLKQAGLAPLQQILAQVSAILSRRLQGTVACDLAPFATAILAIDETTWEAVERHLPSLRTVPKGDLALVPGKLAGRFNIRSQQWDFLQFRDNPVGNSLLNVCSLLEGVAVGSLLLFDLGYFSYAWFDYLKERQFWFVSRIRQGTCYQLAHTFYRQEGVLDALVWLGSTSHNSPHTAQMLRLVRFWDGRDLRMYLTNQLDPLVLPLPDIARLYARRWDIELAFLTLKEHLDLHHWWSAQPVLRQQQALLVLIAAQLLQALRLLIAAEAGRDPFEVSLPLLVQSLPHLLHQHEHPVVWVLTHGTTLGLVRPSSRYETRAPVIPPTALCPPPSDLPLTRKACYRTYPDRPKRTARSKRQPRTRSAHPAPP